MAALLSLAALVPSVSAACMPARPNIAGLWFAGTARTPAAWPRAVQSKIEEYSPFVAAGAAESSAWNMLSKGGNRWSQVGWWTSSNGLRQTFLQYTNDNNRWFTEVFPAAPVGATPNYETIYDIASTDWLWKRDNAVLHTVNAEFQPTTAQADGETHSKASQMPGGIANKVSIFEVHYIPNNGNQWLDTASQPFITDGTIHAAAKLSNEYYTIWDKACGS